MQKLGISQCYLPSMTIPGGLFMQSQFGGKLQECRTTAIKLRKGGRIGERLRR